MYSFFSHIPKSNMFWDFFVFILCLEILIEMLLYIWKQNKLEGLYQINSTGICVRSNPLFSLNVINIPGLIGISSLHCVSKTNKV